MVDRVIPCAGPGDAGPSRGSGGGVRVLRVVMLGVLSGFSAALLGGCGGTHASEDAPALLGTAIPAAAQGAQGADIPPVTGVAVAAPSESVEMPVPGIPMPSPMMPTPTPTPMPMPMPMPTPAPIGGGSTSSGGMAL